MDTLDTPDTGPQQRMPQMPHDGNYHHAQHTWGTRPSEFLTVRDQVLTYTLVIEELQTFSFKNLICLRTNFFQKQNYFLD